MNLQVITDIGDRPNAEPLRTRERRFRVVFVDHVARLSGAEIALLRLLPELSKHVDATVILGEDGPLVGHLRAAGIAVELMPLEPRLRDLRKETVRPGALDARALARLPGYIVRLRRRIRALDADIVQTNSLKAALYAGAAGRLAGVPAIWYVHDRISDDYLPRRAVALVRVASRILPNAVIANSHATMVTLPRGRHRSVVYYPIAAPEPVDTIEDARTAADSTLVIGMVGRLAPWKGQAVFLDAFAEAFEGTDVRARLVGSALFGEDAYAASLRDQAGALGIQDQVEFRGFREDIWAELRELDILVHCSVRPEPFGQVVLEGLTAGLPVVAAAVGGPTELITNGVDGILTAPGNAGELAAAMRRLVANADLRARLGSAGRARSRDFAPERAVERLLAIYGQILGRDT